MVLYIPAGTLVSKAILSFTTEEIIYVCGCFFVTFSEGKIVLCFYIICIYKEHPAMLIDGGVT